MRRNELSGETVDSQAGGQALAWANVQCIQPAGNRRDGRQSKNGHDVATPPVALDGGPPPGWMQTVQNQGAHLDSVLILVSG